MKPLGVPVADGKCPESLRRSTVDAAAKTLCESADLSVDNRPFVRSRPVEQAAAASRIGPDDRIRRTVPGQNETVVACREIVGVDRRGNVLSDAALKGAESALGDVIGG